MFGVDTGPEVAAAVVVKPVTRILPSAWTTTSFAWSSLPMEKSGAKSVMAVPSAVKVLSKAPLAFRRIVAKLSWVRSAGGLPPGPATCHCEVPDTRILPSS